MKLEHLPLGNLLLDQKDAVYNEKLEILNQVQEIFDDFRLDIQKSLEIDNKIAIFYQAQNG